jgi:cytochrome P450
MPRGQRIPAGSTVLVALDSAQFDAAAFPDPGQFRLDRTVEYLHFGYGLHQCFGLAINQVQIPELAAALLRLPNLRRSPGPEGQIVSDGPFPDRLVLQFDRDSAPAGDRKP